EKLARRNLASFARDSSLFGRFLQGLLSSDIARYVICSRPSFPTIERRDRSRMKAIVIHEFGPPDVLKYEDVRDPQPRAGEVRIRVHAATVNRVLDVSLRAGKEMFRGPVLPLIP